MVSPGSVTMKSGLQMCKAWQHETGRLFREEHFGSLGEFTVGY